MLYTPARRRSTTPRNPASTIFVVVPRGVPGHASRVYIRVVISAAPHSHPEASHTLQQPLFLLLPPHLETSSSTTITQLVTQSEFKKKPENSDKSLRLFYIGNFAISGRNFKIDKSTSRKKFRDRKSSVLLDNAFDPLNKMDMKISLFSLLFVLCVLAERTSAGPYFDDEEDGNGIPVDADYSDNALENLMRAAQQKRGCIRRDGNCDHRPNGCCYSSSCRCNLWGSNCRCQRMGLFQKWG